MNKCPTCGLSNGTHLIGCPGRAYNTPRREGERHKESCGCHFCESFRKTLPAMERLLKDRPASKGDRHYCDTDLPGLHCSICGASPAVAINPTGDRPADPPASGTESECERPCDPNSACDECSEYWERMETEGYWDRQQHRWTDRGWHEMLRKL